jgi:hypothetical protein
MTARERDTGEVWTCVGMMMMMSHNNSNNNTKLDFSRCADNIFALLYITPSYNLLSSLVVA